MKPIPLYKTTVGSIPMQTTSSEVAEEWYELGYQVTAEMRGRADE